MEVQPILGLLIAAAIPVVMFALWCEYFRGDTESASQDLDSSTDEEEITRDRLMRIRLAGLMGTVLQLIVFLSTSPVRQQSPAASIAGLLATLAGLVAQRALQLRLEQATIPRGAEGARSDARLFPSAVFWAFAGMLIYFGILFGCVFSSAVAVAVFRIQGYPALAILGTGAVLGYSFALASNFALAPWLFKKMVPSEEVTDPRVLALLSRWFQDSGVATPEFRTLPAASSTSANAWVTGFPNGSGILRPVLWLTPKLLHEISRGGWDSEFEAIAKHEAAHMRLGHLARRFLLAWSMSLLVLGVMVGSLALNAYLHSKQVASALPIFSLAGALALLWLSLGAARRQARRHELEADRFSVEVLGASARSLIQALRKIEEWNRDAGLPEARTGSFGSHPATEERIAALEPLARAEEEASAPETDRRAA